MTLSVAVFEAVPCSFVTGCTAPHYLAEDIHLVAAGPGRHAAPFFYGQVVQCPTHVQHFRRQKLCGSRDSCVEQSAIESTRRKTQLSELQAPAENSLVYC